MIVASVGDPEVMPLRAGNSRELSHQVERSNFAESR
jgi:hypothetical protein